MHQLQDIKNATILISPLDWGFGHTTRSIALIQKLIKQQNRIYFAGNQSQIDFINTELPKIKTFKIAGYNFNFNQQRSLYLQVLKQLPLLSKALKNEKKWLAEFIKSHPVDYIISDNRYGFYHPTVKSIILTHQTNLQIPWGKKIINYFLKKKLENFNTCWIPDFEDQSLSGRLSDNNLSIPTYFIGPLSRFTKSITKNNNFNYKYLFIISGPYPDNFQSYQKVLKYINQLNEKCAVVSTYVDNSPPNMNHADFFFHPNSSSMEKIISESALVICKCGYSSVMDFYLAQKKVLFIPNKNQYEQAYLETIHQPIIEKDQISIYNHFLS